MKSQVIEIVVNRITVVLLKLDLIKLAYYSFIFPHIPHHFALIDSVFTYITFL